MLSTMVLACSLLLGWREDQQKPPAVPAAGDFSHPEVPFTGLEISNYVSAKRCMDCDIFVPTLIQDDSGGPTFLKNAASPTGMLMSLISSFIVLLVYALARMRSLIRLRKARKNFPWLSRVVEPVVLSWAITSRSYIAEASNGRAMITTSGSMKCIEYNQTEGLFSLICDRGWTDDQDYISLEANEIFDGNGHTIDLDGLDKFEGLIEIDESVDTFDKAPIVRNLHMIGGRTGVYAGFILRQDQRFVEVNSCSASGEIAGARSGGIAGMGNGRKGGVVRIRDCHSIGTLTSDDAGAIMGGSAGREGGLVNITRCYSTGNIEGNEAGGIIGGEAGLDSGYIRIKECYSIGRITGSRSGGITGGDTSQDANKVDIIDCYSIGQVGGSGAGGICGGRVRGTLNIINAYSSGGISNDAAGGIIGSIDSSDFDVDVTVRYSVYNGKDNEVVGDDSSLNNDVGNSNNLNDIKGTLYHRESQQVWSEQVWSTLGPEELPILRFQLQNLREEAIIGLIKCIEYNKNDNSFSLMCDREWTGNQHYISLEANEIFDGNGHTMGLEGLNNFEGLFAIDPSIDTFDKAPIIRNLHTSGGKTGKNAGFIVRKEQKVFKVDSCSSSGEIAGAQGGGIAGFHAGYNEGIVHISNCHSVGNLANKDTGGTLGGNAGRNGGQVYITQCHSTGLIEGDQAGGIIGGEGGFEGGYVYIKECYSIGRIAGDDSGGITGDDAARANGEVDIIDCYSRGEVKGGKAGGICGDDVRGIVNIKNTYASGEITGNIAGGIIGSINSAEFDVNVTVRYSR